MTIKTTGQDKINLFEAELELANQVKDRAAAGNLTQALDAFAKITGEINRNNALIGLVPLSVSSGKVSLAENYINEIKKKDYRANLLLLLGGACGKNEPKKGLEYIRQATEIIKAYKKPDLATNSALARALANCGKLDEALAIAKKIRDHDWRFIAQYELVEHLVNKRRVNEAVAIGEKAVKDILKAKKGEREDVGGVAMLLRIVNLLIEQKNKAEAEKIFVETKTFAGQADFRREEWKTEIETKIKDTEDHLKKLI